MLTPLLQNLKNALRVATRNPGLTFVAVLTLALGIGANSAIFSVVDAVMLHPLPYPDPERLASLRTDLRGFGIPDVGMAVVEYEDIRDRSGVIDDIAFLWPMNGNLTGVDRPARIEALAVGENYFRILGAKAFLGRTFQPADVKPGLFEGTVVSYAAWKSLFGGDPRVLGRKIFLDYDSFIVIGVMPPEFRHPGATLQSDVDFWLTGGIGASLFRRADRTRRSFPRALVKLKSGLTVAQAQARLDAFAGQLRADYPNDYPVAAQWAPRLTPLQKDLAGNTSILLLVMLGAVGLVLLICCATIANLFLARAASRQREFAIRGALGALRGNLIGQLLGESFLVALAGGVGGLLLFSWLTPLLVQVAPLNLPRVNPVGVNLSVLAFTMLCSLSTAVLCGLAPALKISKFDLVSGLRDGARGSGTGAASNRTQAALVVCQIALSLMLMVGAGLLLKSFWKLVQVDPGFDPNNVAVASIWLPPPTKDAGAPRLYRTQEQRTAFVRETLRHLRGLPGVEAAAAGAGNSIPLVGWNAAPFGLEDVNVPPGESLSAEMTSVSPDFMRALGLRLVAGRNLSEADDGERRVALIDQGMADRFWNDADPIGRRIRLGPESAPQWWTIVGVVSNMKTDAFDAPAAPHIYFSIYQRSSYGMSLFIRTKADPASYADALRREIRSIDPDLPVFGVRSLEEVVSRSVASRRFALEVIGAFALVALALAGMGVYGVTAFALRRRRREIGIRIALGAGAGEVERMILRQGLWLTAAGLAVGLPGALLLTRFLSSLLYGASPTDPWTYLSVSAVLVGATLLACYLPAKRAAHVDPMVILREE